MKDQEKKDRRIGQIELSQRSQAGWIGSSKYEVIFE